MTLGELYKPSGLARETAQAVLEVKEPWACNVAFGCLNGCPYCYVPRLRYGNTTFRLPSKSPKELVQKQLERMSEQPEGVFVSFCTDPYLRQIRESTIDLVKFLVDRGIRVATLSKLDSPNADVLHGMTVVSLDEEFHKRFEPNTTLPKTRLDYLKIAKGWNEEVWVSCEPYPPSAIYKQNFEDFLENLRFVDLIVFGKWNYDERANTSEARREYRENIRVLRSFCEENFIRLHVKSDTLKFAGLPNDEELKRLVEGN